MSSENAPDLLAPALLGVCAVAGLVLRSLEGTRSRLTMPQVRALTAVYRAQPFSVGQLGSLLAITAPAATRFAARLEHDGWLRRDRDRNDRRLVLLRLTDRGERIVEDVQQRRREELAAALERMGEDDRRTVVAGLGLLAKAFDEPDGPTDLTELGFV